MKIYSISVHGDVNGTWAFTSKRKAVSKRAELIQEHKGDTRYNVLNILEHEFPISAEGVRLAFEQGAGTAPN